MSPIKILELAIFNLFLRDKFRCNIGRPGEVIASLSTDMRNILSKLTSAETQDMRVEPYATVSLRNDDFSGLKRMFDRKILR